MDAVFYNRIQQSESRVVSIILEKPPDIIFAMLKDTSKHDLHVLRNLYQLEHIEYI